MDLFQTFFKINFENKNNSLNCTYRIKKYLVYVLNLFIDSCLS
jgi:hypothetical protein